MEGDDRPVDEKKGDDVNGDGKQPVEKTFTQSELDAIVKDRLERADKKKAAELAKAKEQADADNAKKNGEWQTLAEQREARVKELEALQPTLDSTAAERDQFKAALEDVVKAERKNLPAHIVALLDKLPLLEQREWLAKNKAELMKPTAGGTPKPSPRNNGDKGGQPSPNGRSTVRL